MTRALPSGRAGLVVWNLVLGKWGHAEGSPEKGNVRHCSEGVLQRKHRRGDLIGGRLGDRGRRLFEHEQPCARDLARERFAVADREEAVSATVHHERRYRKLRQALAPARLAVEPGEDHAQLVGHLDRGPGARRSVEDALGGRACGGGVVAQGLGARGGELRDGSAVGPVRHRQRGPCADQRRVVVGQVIVDGPRRNRARTDECECGERVRVLERGDLGDHPADSDARQMGGPVVESAGEGRGIGGKVAKRVRRRLGINRRRRAGVTQVIAHGMTAAASKRLAERFGPGEHGWAAREQHERRCRITEVLEPERDTVGRAERVNRRMHRTASSTGPLWNVFHDRKSGTGRLALPDGALRQTFGVPFELAAGDVDRVLAGLDRARAQNARAAWDWLTASGDVPVVSRYELQYFLWYQLPMKFMTDVDNHLAVAAALGDLLDELGSRGEADLARSALTKDIIVAWDRDIESGRGRMRRAMAESGLEPPDLEELRWGGIMGVEESRILGAAQTALEDAIAAGEFSPGTTGWRQRQASVLRAFLNQADSTIPRRTRIQVIHDERRSTWSAPPSRPVWRELFERAAAAIPSPPAEPAGTVEALAPLARYLEIARSGVKLTAAGYLPPAIVRQMAADFGWRRDWSGEPRTEGDVPELELIAGFAKRAGLVRRGKVRLSLSEPGRRALAARARCFRRRRGRWPKATASLRRSGRSCLRCSSSKAPLQCPSSSHGGFPCSQRRDGGPGTANRCARTRSASSSGRPFEKCSCWESYPPTSGQTGPSS